MGSSYNPSTRTGKTLWVDSVYGTAGGTGTPAAPFLTLTAAKTAASSGDLIHVRPGTYAERNLLKNGVNWYFDPGANVVITTSDPSNADPVGSAIFDDSSLGANGAVVCSVDGFGVFERIQTLSGHESTIRITNASSDVTIRCQSIRGGNNIYYAVWGQGGRLSIECRTITSEDVYAVAWSNGEMFVTAEDIVAEPGGAGCPVFADTTTGWTTGSLWVRANRILQQAVALSAIFALGNTGARVWIEAQKIQSATGCVSLEDIKLYITAQKIESTNAVLISTASGELWINVLKSECLGVSGQAFDFEGGTIHFTGQTIAAESGFDSLVFVAGGLVEMNVPLIQTTGANQIGVHISTGTLRLNGVRIDASAGSSANPAYVEGGSLVLSGCVLVAESGRDSITADSAKNVVAMSSWANKAVDANVTIATTGGLTVDAAVV